MQEKKVFFCEIELISMCFVCLWGINACLIHKKKRAEARLSNIQYQISNIKYQISNIKYYFTTAPEAL